MHNKNKDLNLDGNNIGKNNDDYDDDDDDDDD
jgi:hypothetical protein